MKKIVFLILILVNSNLYAVSPSDLIAHHKMNENASDGDRFTVSDDGITRIHDLVNDPDRDCVWGITRADAAVNYVFSMERDGTITKFALGGSGVNKGMFIDWGGEYLWAVILSNPAQLLRIHPDTNDLTFYEVTGSTYGATCLTYQGDYIFIGTYQDDSNESEIFRFDISAETFVKYTVEDVNSVYWAAFDGEYSWFGGENPVSGYAALVKMATDGTYSTYDLGANDTGAEIAYDGTHIWYGSNEGANTQLIRFDTGDDSITVIDTPFPPRLVGFDEQRQLLWLVSTTDNYTRMGRQSLSIELSKDLPDSTYSHGLTFDGSNAWIGTWQDTCYLYKVNIIPATTVFDSSGNEHTGESQQNTEDIDVAGKINGAFDFNGSSDYIEVADHADFTPAGTPFSISAWVYMHDATNFYITTKGLYNVTGEWWFFVGSSDRLGMFVFDDNVTSCFIGREYSTQLTAYQNQWIHVVGTYDGGTTPGSIRLYIDGIRVDDTDKGSNPGSFVSCQNGGGNVMIGRYSTNYVNGLIDNVMFFSTVLTLPEIQILYNNGAATEIPAELNEQISPRRHNLSPLSVRRRYEF